MAEITIVKPHDEGKSALEVTVNGEKWSLIRGETADVPEYIAEEVRRSLAQRESLSLSDIDEREDTGEGEGGGGSNVETATIEITVTDSTPAITNGEFPDWCTEANSDYVYGKVLTHNIIIEGEEFDDSVFGIVQVQSYEGSVLVVGNSSGESIILATDLSLVLLDNANIESGTLTINLFYMPEE